MRNMFQLKWLSSLQKQLKSSLSTNIRSRRSRHRGSCTPVRTGALYQQTAENLEDRTLLTAFTVMNANDSGTGSLRSAIEAANANSGADTISFDAALAGQTIILTDELLVTDDLTITGLGASQLTLDGDNNSRVFQIDDSSGSGIITVEITGLTLTNGYSTHNGGAILSSENLIVEDCVFTGNTADKGGAIYDDASSLSVRGSLFSGNIAATSDGGAIYHSETFPYPSDEERMLIENSEFTTNYSKFSGGAVLLRDGIGIIDGCLFTQNTADFPGGAIRNIFGSLTVTDSSFVRNATDFSGAAISNGGELEVQRSTFEENTAEVNGGAIYSQGADEVTILNSTFSGNSSVFDGGGIFVLGNKPVSVINSTIVDNESGRGGGIYLFGTDPTMIANTIIAGNRASNDPQVYGSFTGTANVIQASFDGLLDPVLKDNGGPTKTHALLPDSIAINAGDNSVATDAGLTTDQRGTGFERVIDGLVDIGAFEATVTGPDSLIVDTTSDVDDGDYSVGQLSLREAILLANANSGADTITFAAALAGQSIILTGELLISDDLTITGLGADQLTLDGNYNSRIFRVDNGNQFTRIMVEIEGLTLTNGNSIETGATPNGYGGAIMSFEDLTVKNSVIKGNHARLGGGGIYSSYASLTIENSLITENTAEMHGGAGVYYLLSGGMGLSISESTFSFNATDRRGGAVFFNSGVASIRNSTFTENYAGDGGAGVYNNTGSMTIESSTVAKNISGYNGGGLYNSGELFVSNSTISENSALHVGAGIYSFTSAHLEVTSSTIVLNYGRSSLSQGGGIYGSNTTAVSITNSIVAANKAASNPQIAGLYTSPYNIVTDGLSGLLDPVLRDNGGTTKTHALLPGSAAVDAGRNLYATDAGLSTDQRGTGYLRIANAKIDIGAFETQVASLIVDNSSDIDDGDYTLGQLSLREAIELANLNPVVNSISFAASLSGQAIVLSEELMITDHLVLSGPGADQLTLDGNGTSRIFNIDNGDPDISLTVEIEGLTLTNGDSSETGAMPDGFGGAILSFEDLTIKNSILQGNHARLGGGGIYSSNASLTIENSQFIENTAGQQGGGIYYTQVSGTGLSVDQSTFSTNSADLEGGGIYVRRGDASIQNSTFTDNSAGVGGGAVLNGLRGTTTINASTFYQNRSDYNGGALYNSGELFVSNSTLSENSARELGGGIYSFTSAQLEVINSTIVANQATSDISRGGGIYGSNANATTLANSIIAGNTAANLSQISGLYTDTSNLIADSLTGLVDPVLSDNGGPTKTHALLPGSAAINAGSNAAAMNAGLSMDQRGTGYSRILEGTVDIGAVETQLPYFMVDVTSDVDDGDYSDGHLSLREAVKLANNSPVTNLIVFDSSLAGQTILLHSELVISDHLTITGLGADQLTLDGNHNNRIFLIDDGDLETTISIEIDGLSLVNGSTYSTGGAILSFEDLILKNSTLKGNHAELGGGGIYSSHASLTIENSLITENSATAQAGGGVLYFQPGDNGLTINQSTFSHNTSGGDGGAVYFDEGVASIRNSTFTENQAEGEGGAVQNGFAGSMTIESSTFNQNRAEDKGGALSNLNELYLRNSTLSENSADYIGGGIYTYRHTTLAIVNSTIVLNHGTSDRSYGGGIYSTSPNTIQLSNSIVAGNTAVNDRQVKADIAGSSNIISDSIAGLIDPVLRDNDGFTKTHALLSNSAALDAGDNTAATAAGLTTDQRGTGFARILNGTVDVGAFEAAVAHFLVDTASDVDDGDYSAGQLSLREAIKLANAAPSADIISFDASLTGQTIVVTAELVISDDLTIIGLGADQLTISGGGTSRILNITDHDSSHALSVEISGLTFTNAYATYGAAILNYETLLLKETILTENTATQSGAGIYSSQGNVLMTDSSLTSNHADRGAGIYSISGILTLNHSTISGNVSTREGAGIYYTNFGGAETTPSVIIESTFTGNRSSGSGGGLYNSRGIFNVIDSTFSSNEAVLGGGIYSTTNTDVGSVSVVGSTFSGNIQVESGGGIYNSGAVLSIEDSFFTGNAAVGENSTGLGGGIYSVNGPLTVTRTEFSGNTATLGGGIYSGLDGSLSVTDSLFLQNQGRSGGGIFNTRAAMTILGSRFIENQALTDPEYAYLSSEGGAVYHSPAPGTEAGEQDAFITDSEFTDNFSDTTGGAVKLYTGYMTIADSVFVGNRSDLTGGAVDSLLGHLTVRQSAFSGNTSDTNGGAISSTGPLLLSESSIAENSTKYYGGGVYLWGQGTATIENTTLSGNRSLSRGGGLYSTSDQPLTLINTTITGNSSGRGGGVASNSATPLVINTIIAGNSASQNSQIDGTYTGGNNIIQDSIAGLLDPVLRDNGGSTLTHALLLGSAAINAGDNTAVNDAGLTTDQRGTGFSRIQDGTVDIGAYEVQIDHTQVDFRIVSSKTSTGSNGEVDSLPESREWIDEWGGYWLEIWISTPAPSDRDIRSITIDFSYNTAITTATAIEYGAAFSTNQTGTLNDQTGRVESLSAETSLSDVGYDRPVLFARIRFEPTVDDAVNLDRDGQSLNPQSTAYSIENLEILDAVGAVRDDQLILGAQAQIFANPFDLNDDDKINYRDLILFASVYQHIPSQSNSENAWFSDYNQDNAVNYRDLIQFAVNYGKHKSGSTPVHYLANYPDIWNQLIMVDAQQSPQETAARVKQSEAETVLESTIAEISPQLTTQQQQTLSEIDIKVVDLSDETLGRAAAGTIYIDVNAAGYGWFIDTTPAEHSEFSQVSDLTLIALPDSEAAGLIDLRTVILHELSHLLGYEHDTNGLMQETLSPGVRYLPDWESATDEFFGALTDETAPEIF